MSKRFNVLKNNENIFKRESGRKKKLPNRGVDNSSASPFKTPKKIKQSTAPEMFQKVRRNIEKPKEFKLEEVAFPDLGETVLSPVTKPPALKLNFGNVINRERLNNNKVVVKPRAKLEVNVFDSEKYKKALKINSMIDKYNEEQESKRHFMIWYKNWQDDRNIRMEQGETFYEPYDLEDIDDLSDSDLSDDYEMEETEYWGSSRYKQSYDN